MTTIRSARFKCTMLFGVGFAVLAFHLAPVHADQADDDRKLAQGALTYFKKYCAECHHGDKPTSEVTDYDVLNFESLTKQRKSGDKSVQYVQAGVKGQEALKLSQLWKRAGVANQVGAEGDMPPDDAKAKPTDGERQAILGKWLESGAPAWPQEMVAAGQANETQPVASEGELWFEVRNIFEQRCMKCHNGPTPQSGVTPLQIVDYESLTRSWKAKDRADRITDWPRDPWYYVKPGQASDALLDESLLYYLIKTDKMPRGSEKLTAGEKAVVKAWIAAGAPVSPAPAARPYVSRAAQVVAVLKHLQATAEKDRPYQRYFTFAHWHNNSAIYDKELNAYRAGFAKLINSLSWKSELVAPQALPDTQGAVLTVDLRKLGWDQRDLWNQVLKDYPYASDDAGDTENFRKLTGTPLPFLRADWFVTKASRPPLYHALLELPSSATQLEKKLGIDFLRNFHDGKLARAGYLGASTTTSGFRVVERQPIVEYQGAYWKSYDFGSGELAQDDHRLRNPLLHALGPKFEGHPHDFHAFMHDGCEIIFNLPNGLQAYLVVDWEGRRIDAPPIWVLKDKNEFAGTPQLVNGISCIACHSQGMQSVSDQVHRQFETTGGREIVGGRGATGASTPEAVVDHIRKIYVPKETMDGYLKGDEKRFTAAATATMKEFLADARGRMQTPKLEPIYAVTLRYRQHLGLEEVARELNFEDVSALTAVLTAKPQLLKGLGIQDRLVQSGGKISREEWTNAFVEAARKINHEQSSPPKGK